MKLSVGEAEGLLSRTQSARDEALARVIEASRNRAGDWLMWVAYTVSSRNATRVPESAVPQIKKIVGELAEELRAEPVELDYSRVYKDNKPATWGGASHVLDTATKPFVLRLLRHLSAMGMHPGQYADQEFLMSRFAGKDGFNELLNAWAAAETEFRNARALHSEATAQAAREQLRSMWGNDVPVEGPPGQGSREW